MLYVSCVSREKSYDRKCVKMGYEAAVISCLLKNFLYLSEKILGLKPGEKLGWLIA